MKMIPTYSCQLNLLVQHLSWFTGTREISCSTVSFFILK